MNARQRGAACLLVALLAGRALDRFDLPFEARPDSTATPVVTVASGAPPVADAAAPAPSMKPPPPRPARTAAPPAAPIAINTATARELESLPGVGPVLAARIVAHRDSHGAFTDLAALRAVAGIGPRTLERLSPQLRFD